MASAGAGSPKRKRPVFLDDSLDSDFEDREPTVGEDSLSDFDENGSLLPVFGLSSPKKAKPPSSSSSDLSPPVAIMARGREPSCPEASGVPQTSQMCDAGRNSLAKEADEPKAAASLEKPQIPAVPLVAAQRSISKVHPEPLASEPIPKSPARLGHFLNSSHIVSPLKSSIDEHRKTADDTKKLYSKGRKLSKVIKEKNEMKEKLRVISRGGGIRGAALKWEEEEKQVSRAMSQGDTHATSSVELSPTAEASAVHFNNPNSSLPDTPSLPVKPPGKAVFVNPPSPLTELYPPGVELLEGGAFAKLEGFLTQDNPQALREMVCGRWLTLCYEHKPCPHTIRQWLFQLMCLASDDELSSGAYRSLISLLKLSKQNGEQQAASHPPSLDEVIGVLVSLGADRSRLLPGGDAAIMPQETDGHDDVFDAPGPPLCKLSRLINYLSAFAEAFPSCYSTGELKDLVLILLGISLDPTLCGQLIETNIRQSICALVAAIPEDDWREAAISLSERALKISKHHHSRLHIVTTITDVSPRQRLLQEIISRESILQELGLSEVEGENGSVGEGETPLEVEAVETETRMEVAKNESLSVVGEASSAHIQRRCSFFQRIIRHYCHMRPEDINYYSMYSILLLLYVLIHPLEMQWSSEKDRKEFEGMVGQLSTKIRDSTLSPERGPVKDFLIRMKLEISSQKAQGPKQMPISAMFGSN